MSQLDSAMTFEEVSEILRIVDAAPRGGELTVQLGGASLTVKLQGETAATAPAAAAPPAAAAAGVAASEPVDHAGLVAVTSPMTGVWYRSPVPGEPPFVEVGDVVEEGQQVGIIEVMKLMNRIVAPCDGTVREVCIANEELAEFGATLVWIEPAAG